MTGMLLEPALLFVSVHAFCLPMSAPHMSLPTPTPLCSAHAIESALLIVPIHALTCTSIQCFAYHAHHSHRASFKSQAMAVLATPTQDTLSNPVGKAKRQRARDANAMDNNYTAPSHPHPYRRMGPTPTHSFRPNPIEQPQTFCVVCLRRPHPNIGECREETLNDGEPAFSTRNKLGHLVDRQNKSLCVDFQLSKSCPSKRHAMRHRCSGCGSDQHGAVDCPRRSSN